MGSLALAFAAGAAVGSVFASSVIEAEVARISIDVTLTRDDEAPRG